MRGIEDGGWRSNASKERCRAGRGLPAGAAFKPSRQAWPRG